MTTEICDQRFYKHKTKYIIQCSLATLALLAVLLSLNVMPNAVVIASIGSTAFVVFIMLHRKSSGLRYIMGGYLLRSYLIELV